MALSHKHVVLIGATSGIGKGMAERFIESGTKVTAVGRRQERLDDFVKKHGAQKVNGVAFDIANYKKAPQFADEIMQNSPDIDCLFLNAGVQRQWDLSNLENINLDDFNDEMTINYTSFVALVQAFLPYLKKQQQSSIVFVGSHLSIIPAAVLPNYSASKAALNVFTMCLREQLKAAGSTVKVIEISGPPVQTELHDYMGVETGRKLGMPLDDFTRKVMDRLNTDSDEIIIGGAVDPKIFDEVLTKRRDLFERLAGIMRSMAAKDRAK